MGGHTLFLLNVPVPVFNAEGGDRTRQNKDLEYFKKDKYLQVDLWNSWCEIKVLF